MNFEFDPSAFCGWIDHPDRYAVAATMPAFGQIAAPLMRAGAPDTDVLMYRAWKDTVGSYVPYPRQEIGDCFPAGTMVLGESIKPIESVQVGDRVWTGQGRLTEVVSVRALQTMRPLVEVDAVGLPPVRCTADHRFLVYRMGRAYGKRVTPNLYRKAVSGGVAETARAQAAIAVFETRTPEWIAAADLREDDHLLSPIAFEALTVPESPGGLLDTAEGRFVAGYFLGNGHASGGTVEWTLPNDSPHTDRLVAALRACGYVPKVEPYVSRNAQRVRVHSVELVQWIRASFYDAQRVKAFPGWAVGDAAFLEGLVGADGDQTGGALYLDSTSLAIVYGAAASLAVLGHDATIRESTRSRGTYDNAKPLYRVMWRPEKQRQWIWRDDQYLCRRVRSIRFLEGPSTVYDIGVADPHHSFLANGIAVHNCVSFGHSHGNDLLLCVEAALQGVKFRREEIETDTEALYGMAREAGNMLGWQDGCYGSAAVKAMTTMGMLPRSAVGPYSGHRAKEWGYRGTPDDVKQKAAAWKLGNAALVKTWDELAAAMANGYPVTICTGMGFTMHRDEHGFCTPSGRWGHCMLLCGIRYGARPGACVFQSWGPNVPDGPLDLDQPDNSFWVDRGPIERILAEGDSWALSKSPFFVARPLPSHWKYASAA